MIEQYQLLDPHGYEKLSFHKNDDDVNIFKTRHKNDIIETTFKNDVIL